MTLKPFTDRSIGLEIDSCTECTGLWFDAHELTTFLKSDVMKQRFLWLDGSEPLSGVSYVINTAPRRCPRDKTAMEEKIYGGITLDCCPRCKGLWFDEGEVRLIVERFRRGAGHGDAEVAKELRDGLSDARPAEGGLSGLLDFIKGLVGRA
jgi:Zn-finger nucleic acid-binding protein